MGMYATIKGNEYKFSGILAMAYANLFGAPQDCVIKLTPHELKQLINQYARMLELDAMMVDAKYPEHALQAALNRQQNTTKLIALIDYHIDFPKNDLVFA